MTKRKFLVDRRALMKQTGGVVAGALAAPMIGHAEANTVRIRHAVNSIRTRCTVGHINS